jgi:hypothetical protein
VETAPEPAPLQAEITWCLGSGRVLTRCGIYWATIVQVDAEGRIEVTLHWAARGAPEHVLTARRVFPATWSRYEPLFIAHLAAELLSRAIELHYEG